MTGLQQKMLDLVLEVDEICKKHNIEYYMAGGSVLGAVRHDGYIPWDDDIDIMMTRAEFEKFQNVCAKELDPAREIITTKNTPCHTKVTIKYMDKTTSQFFRSQVLDTTGCGISLDIFILDPLPADPKKKEKHILEYIVYNELLTPFFMVNENLYKCVPMYRFYQRLSKIVGKKWVMNFLYNRLFVKEPKESDQYLYRWGQQLLIYDHDVIGKPHRLSFEGHMLPMPEKTLDFLRSTYGDGWKYIPPQNLQETHTSNLSLNVAYINWLQDINLFLDREQVLKDFVTRKEYNVQKAVPYHDDVVMRAKAKALMMELEIKHAKAFRLESLLNNDDEGLDELLKEYYGLQLDKNLFKNNIFISVSDKKLAIFLNHLIKRGDYVKAEKILKLRKMHKKELSKQIISVEKNINRIRKYMYIFEEDKKLGKFSKLKKWFNKYPDYLDYIRFMIQAYLRKGKLSDKKIKSIVKAGLKKYPADPELAYLAGCVYGMFGKEKKKNKLWNFALEGNNGMVIKAINRERNEE